MKQIQAEVDALTLSERWTMTSECEGFSDPEKSFQRTSAVIAWVLLIVFNVLYVGRETTKLIHLRDRREKMLFLRQ